MAVILVIDDNRDFRKVVAKMLASSGHTTIEADDGREGLALFTANSPDLVITDVLMPNMDGIDTIKAIKTANSDAKIIAISGGGRRPPPLFLDTAKTFGADAILTKPVRSRELLDTVARLVEG